MLQFFKTSGHLIAFGFILTFLSGFGQTFLISLYVPDFQNYFSLSDGLFSSFYAVATLGSAFHSLGLFLDLGVSFDQLTIASLFFMFLIILNSLRVLRLKKVD